MRILLVDDDEALMETLAESLIKQRYAVDIAIDGETAQEFLALFSYDLIVLDMLLPDISGISLCQQFRRQGIHSPILMLTARDTSTDKVQALDAGADDYVVKPFDFEELCARIRALLRRDSQALTSVLNWGDLSLNSNTFEVFYGERQLHTTPKEYALLELFLRHPSRLFSLDAIIENLWSFEDPPSGDAVRTHIKGLRQKLKAGGAPKDLIETVYGLGYRLNPLEPVKTSSQVSTASDAQKQPSKSEIEAAVAKAWEMHQDTMRERLSVLEAAAAALKAGQLNTDLQRSGRSQAHKLAGSLGCFGFSEGSRIARELEQLLQLDAPLDHHAGRLSALVQRLRQNLDSGDRSQTISAEIAISPKILLVGANDPLTQYLTTEALALGMCSVAATTPTQARALLHTQPPDGVLLWLDAVDIEDAMTLLSAISQQEATIPVLIVTAIQDFHQRLRLVQQGADRLLPAVTSPRQAIEAIQQTLQTVRQAFKVVIVDDDPQVLDLLRTLLSPWGFQLTTLENPTQLWSTLEEIQPHLLILDVEMPGANGLEICQVLRADAKWRCLPILFLTVHEDISTQQQAFNVGADDFISKPVAAADLANRILNRLRRSPQS